MFFWNTRVLWNNMNWIWRPIFCSLSLSHFDSYIFFLVCVDIIILTVIFFYFAEFLSLLNFIGGKTKNFLVWWCWLDFSSLFSTPISIIFFFVIDFFSACCLFIFLTKSIFFCFFETQKNKLSLELTSGSIGHHIWNIFFYFWTFFQQQQKPRMAMIIVTWPSWSSRIFFRKEFFFFLLPFFFLVHLVHHMFLCWS